MFTRLFLEIYKFLLILRDFIRRAETFWMHDLWYSLGVAYFNAQTGIYNRDLGSLDVTYTCWYLNNLEKVMKL